MQSKLRFSAYFRLKQKSAHTVGNLCTYISVLHQQIKILISPFSWRKTSNLYLGIWQLYPLIKKASQELGTAQLPLAQVLCSFLPGMGEEGRRTTTWECCWTTADRMQPIGYSSLLAGMPRELWLLPLHTLLWAVLADNFYSALSQLSHYNPGTSLNPV